MKVEISIDERQNEPKIVIVAKEINDDVRNIMEDLSNYYPRALYGYTGQEITVIKEMDIIRIYGEHQKVFCETKEGTYLLHNRLYEMEDKLNSRIFVRISNSEIVNSKKIVKLDASITGTIVVYLEQNIKTYSSRRYVKRIKEVFGL